MKEYSSSYSKGMLVSTCVITLFLLSCVYYLLGLMRDSSTDSPSYWGALLGVCIILFVYLYACLSQIRSVSITDEAIVVNKVLGRTVIPYQGIVGVMPKKRMAFNIRLWGMGGLFGYHGDFWDGNIGSYTAYANNGGSLIAIKTKKKVYVISCDNHLEAIEMIIGKLTQSSRNEAR